MPENNPDNDRFSRDMPTPQRTWLQRLLALVLILIILLAGYGVARYLIATKPVAKRKQPAKIQTLVSIMEVAPTTTSVTVKALGRIVPAHEITLQAQVSGLIEYLHPEFTPGGIIKKGEVVVRIEATDYQLELKQKQNLLAQARADLRIEEGNQIVAEQEWKLIQEQSEDLDTSSEDLALRKPQLEKARADINVAKTEIEKARVDLERTVIKAPFNAVVREKNVDLGSQVTSQSAIVVLTGIDTFWAEVSVPVDNLDWIVLPHDETSGSKVMVYANGGIPYEGNIVKLMPDLDPDGLMARLVVAVKDPMGMKTNRKPLLLGSFIRAEITGRKVENIFQIPRASLMEGNKVLIAAPDETLHIQPVSVTWKNTDYVFIGEGLKAGDRIIVSNVPAPIEGMPLEINGMPVTAGREKGKEAIEVTDNERE